MRLEGLARAGLVSCGKVFCIYLESTETFGGLIAMVVRLLDLQCEQITLSDNTLDGFR